MQHTYLKINQPQVVHEAFEDEVVIVNLDTGNYYSLEGAGADIWRGIEQGALVDEITEATAHRYDGPRDEIQVAVKKLLDDLQSEQLVTLCEAADRGPVGLVSTHESNGDGKDKPTFQTPVLNRFTDMQELLLLDPVHDVDETGWPRPKDAAAPQI